MRNIALLIRKDILSILMTPSSIVVTLFLFVFLIGVNTALVFVLVIYMMVINLFTYEENDLVCNVTGILPIRMREAVLARYVYAWLLLLATTIVGGACSFVINTFLTNNGGAWFTSLLFALASALLMLSIIMPLNYKLGTMRARVASMIVYIVMVAASTAVSTVFSFSAHPAAADFAASMPIVAIAGLSVLGGIVLSVISLFISLNIKRD